MHNRLNQTIYVAYDGQEDSDIEGVFLEDVEVRQDSLSIITLPIQLIHRHSTNTDYQVN